MAGEILSGILGVVFLVAAVLQFQCKGPVWSTEYFASTIAEKQKLKNKSEYYWSAIACLLIGLLFLLTLLYTIIGFQWILYLVFVLAAILFAHIIYGIFREMKKSTVREPKKRRTRDEDEEE